ncbi:hypothetical protein VTK56DRAFT_10222 [Thermocarpiscus australiensis]
MTLIPPENRAVVPATSGLPSTMVSAASTPIRTDHHPSPEGKCRTIQGPSAKEWERHRETIISLYREYPLKRVSDIMRRHYGFSASKRMYDKRFREWNVFKNTNSDERERNSRRGHALPSTAGAADHGEISQEDLRRTVRCARTIQQGLKGAPATSFEYSATLTTTQSPGPSPPSRPARRSISICDILGETPAQSISIPEPSGRGTPPQAPCSSGETPCDTPISAFGSSDDQSQDGSAVRTAPVSPGPGLATYKAQIRDLAMSPPPYIAPDSRTRTMGVITLKLQEYYDWQLENIPKGVLPDDYLGHRSPDESTRYWNTIKNAIYLVKLSAGSTEDLDNRPDRRAWPALAEAGCLAADAMTSQPFDFLRNLFATLSPANTSARPELRGILLQFLASEARSTFSPNHPITLICQELQRDENCQEISRRSLQCMLDVLNGRLGRSRAITFKLLDSLATLLRRNGEFQAASEIMVELFTSCRQVFGAGSEQARTVENELAHFYMLADQYDLALGHCMSVVTRPPAAAAALQQGEEGREEEEADFYYYYQDGISAHTMEDIAEIHQRRGDIEQCITWLERAAAIALRIWGPKSVATGHIIDKMTSLQRQFGRDLLKSAALWEAAVV